MANLESLINQYASKLRDAKSLSEIRNYVEKEIYKKFGMSKRAESMAYEIADCVADKIKKKR
jgi:hypothetical protein